MDSGAKIKAKDGFWRYGLVGIDNFTKKGEVALMDYRTPKAVKEAAIIILKELGIPKQICTDGEGYFMGKEFAALCSRHDIKHIMTSGKANSAERFIRTLKENIFKRLEGKPREQWIDEVGYVVDKYNRSRHSTTELSPDDATDPRNEMFVRYNIFDKAKTDRKWPPLKEGDSVRIKKVRQTGAKGYDPKYSKNVFKIHSIRDGTYHIKIPLKLRKAFPRQYYQRFELLKV